MFVVFHKDCLLHSTGYFHPERKERIIPLIEKLEKLDYVNFVEPEFNESYVEKVHPKEYIEEFKSASKSNIYLHTTDCPLSKDTYKAAVYSASGAVLACEISMKSEEPCLSVLRPPGHHARKAQAMGFCYFNNVAIASKYLLEKWNLRKIAIIDWDAHHGNGTQEIFYDTSKVFYTSMHGHPLITYPGTGFSEEKGIGEGEGYTLNFPLFPEVQDEEYLRIFEEKLIPALDNYNPEFCLVSCGFDAHKEDPLVPNLRLSDETFEKLFEITLEFAKEKFKKRVVFILEGGYNPEVVKRLGLKLVEKIEDG